MAHVNEIKEVKKASYLGEINEGKIHENIIKNKRKTVRRINQITVMCVLIMLWMPGRVRNTSWVLM